MKPPEGASASASEFKQNIQEKIEEKALEENKIQSEGFIVQEKENNEVEKIQKDEITIRKWFKNKKLRTSHQRFQKEIIGLISQNFPDIKLFERQVVGRSSCLALKKNDKEKIEKSDVFINWEKKIKKEKPKESEITLRRWLGVLEIGGRREKFYSQIEELINKINEEETKKNENFEKIILLKRKVAGKETPALKTEDKEKIENNDIFINWLEERKKEKVGKDEITLVSWLNSYKEQIALEWVNLFSQIEELINKINEEETKKNENFEKIILLKRKVAGKETLALKTEDKEKIENNDIFINWLEERKKEKVGKDEITLPAWLNTYYSNNYSQIKELINKINEEETKKNENFEKIILLKRKVSGKETLALKTEDKEKIEKSDVFIKWIESKKKEVAEREKIEKIKSDEISLAGWFKSLDLAINPEISFYPQIKEMISQNFPDIKLFERRVVGHTSLALKKIDKEKIKSSDVFIEWLAQKNVKKQEKEKQELENQKSEQLENFCKNQEQNREFIRDFLDLTQIYGPSKCVDIVYILHPEFRDLPQEKVKKIIGKYLGDFMMSRGSLDYNFHKTAAEFLSDLDFRNAAKEFFKDNCYRKLIKLKKTGYIKEEALMDIIREYRLSFEDIKINKEILQDIISEVEKYYQDIFDFDKPERFVDELKEGVSFPSLNQKINVKELEEKKSLLIADKMGTGKSASVLMAKEYLRVNKCLLMVPSNVLETWKGYLSDDPKQKGCYKTGQAPKTLFLENPKDLDKLNDDQWEYVIMSLEKMKESYLDPLKKIGFEMVVVDEIHKLKNPRGFRAQKLFDFIGEKENQNQYFCALSGTPAPNKVKDFAVSIKSLYADNKKIANMDIKDLTYNIIRGHQVDLRSMLMPKMQMKEMSESLEMSEKEEIVEELEMTENEKMIYNNILDNDELTASEKIITLRKFLLNPELFIKTDQKFEGSKVKKLKSLLREKFLVENESRVIVFVNDYIDGVIRDDEQGKSIIDKLGLPKDIKILSVHGENEKDRSEIQKEFNNRETKGEEKILLLVSGQTADVGVDYTGADSLIVYNEPWSEYDLQQQIARVYRPGLDHDLKVHRLVVQDSIEKGIHDYIKLKQKAIEKVLQGIPRNELEEQILIEDEGGDELVKINNTLADKYLSRQDRQTKRFGYCAELGEEGFVKEVVSTKHGPEYAENYHEMGRRSYQSNLNRVSGTIIKELCRFNKQKANEIKIADFGSGPEMLRRHIGEDYQNNVYSLDINPAHFDYCNPEDKNKKWFEGSIKNSPFKNKEFDYLNISAAFHYTESLNYGKGTTERLETLVEMNRVLKEGGTALLNMVYVYRFRNMDDFETAIKHFGFEVVKNFTGEMSQKNNFSSNLITLKKIGSIELSLDEILEKMTKNERDSFKLRRQDKKLANTLDIIREFNIGDKKLKIDFNKEDKAAFQEEQEIKLQAEKLKLKYGKIANIPPQKAEEFDFWITFYNNRYVLMKKMKENRGVVYVREKK